MVKPSKTPTGRSTSSINFAPTLNRPSSGLLALGTAPSTPASSAGRRAVPMLTKVTFDASRGGVKRGIQRALTGQRLVEHAANAAPGAGAGRRFAGGLPATSGGNRAEVASTRGGGGQADPPRFTRTWR